MYSANPAPTLENPTVPRRLFVVPVVIFVMVTSEFMISPLLPAIAEALGRPLGQAALLITALAVGQVIGGITLGVLLSRIRPAVALAGLALAFSAVQATPIFTSSWPAVLGTRLVAGLVMASMFTVALTAAGTVVPPALMARASGVVFSGVTFGLTIGSPLAGWLGGLAGWRWAFAAVSIAGIVSALAVLTIFRAPVPPRPVAHDADARRPLRDPRLWATYLTGMLLVGAAAASYGFFGALLQQQTGWAPTAISLVLLGYGVASIVGNLAVARHSGARPDRTIAAVASAAVVCYVIAAVGIDQPWVLVATVVALGALGFTLNPAVMALVVLHSGNRAVTNALSATAVTLGIVVGSAAAGVLVDQGYGVRAPLLLSAAVTAVAVVVVRAARPASRDVPTQPADSAAAEVVAACEVRG